MEINTPPCQEAGSLLATKNSRHPEQSGDGSRQFLCLMSYFSTPSSAPETVMGIIQGQGGEEVLQSTAARKNLRILQFCLKMMKKCEDSGCHPGKEMKERIAVI